MDSALYKGVIGTMQMLIISKPAVIETGEAATSTGGSGAKPAVTTKLRVTGVHHSQVIMWS